MKLFKNLCLFIVMIFIIVLSLAGCEALSRTDFEFLADNSEIELIEIVKIGKLDENAPTHEFLVINEIQDAEQFLKDFSDVECYNRFTDPSGPLEGYIGIKITYNNGDYEVICASGQSEYIDGMYSSHEGWHSFEKTQFDELINKYINGPNDVSIS